MTTRLDDFERVDASTLGANWTAWSWSGAASLHIVSGAVVAPAPNTYGNYWVATDAFAADQFSEVTVAVIPNSSEWIGCTVRQATPGTGYLAIWFNGTFMLFNENGSLSPALISSASGTLSPGDVIKLEAIGNAIKVYKNGTQVISVTDTTYTTGQPGLAIYGTSGTIAAWEGSDSGGSFVNIDTTSFANVVQNCSVRRWVKASGGTGPYTWDITTGSLPAGMSLSASGELTGTPTGTVTSTFTLRATDSLSATATKSLSITSVSAPLSPASPSTDGNGVITWSLTSPINTNSAQTIRVLVPPAPSSGYDPTIWIVVPVNSGTDDTTFGNALDTIRTLGLHNQYNATIIEPSTGGDWMADNPSDSTLLQETYLQQIVAWAKATYGSVNIKVFICGFSRSGLAVMSLFMNRPDLYAGVAAWDSPVMMSASDGTDANGTVGGNPASSYGTNDNYQANYRLSPANLVIRLSGTNLGSVKRVWIGGHNFFLDDVSQFDPVLTTAGILHTYDDVAASAHNWSPTPQWLPTAFSALLGAPKSTRLMFMSTGIV